MVQLFWFSRMYHQPQALPWFSPGRSSPSLDPLRKSPTLDQVSQTAPSAQTPATTAPAPGLGRRSPAHSRTAPSTTSQSSQKVQHQDGVDTRRGETVRGGRSSQGWSAPRTITAVDRTSTAGLTHSVFSHTGETSLSDLCCCHTELNLFLSTQGALLTQKDIV